LTENHGLPEVAILDIFDFQFQSAAVHYFSFPNEYEKDIEVREAECPSNESRTV
jgi:hypothetical protein